MSYLQRNRIQLQRNGLLALSVQLLSREGMAETVMRRRAVLRAIAGTGLGAVSVSASRPARAHISRRMATRELSVPGSEHTLEVMTTTAGTNGPTALVVGGVHGDEIAGYRAAESFANWTPEAGKLVLLPRANPGAIADDSRSTGTGDLNRKFVPDEQPTTPLARTIWNFVLETNPDALMSLHESRGIFGGEPAGVGQTVFCSPRKEGYDAAQMGVRRANRSVSQSRLAFKRGTISPPDDEPIGLLTEKATYDANIPSFIVETYWSNPLAKRIGWHQATVRGVLDYFDLID